MEKQEIIQDKDVQIGDVETRDGYLLERHGTLELIPLPTSNPQDPLNWSSWKKNINLALVAFHGLIATGSAVAVVPAFQPWTVLYNESIVNVAYLASNQLVALAIGPLFWVPIANRHGRLPVWMISAAGAGLLNVGCALSQTYGSHLALRFLSAFFISPGIAMGQAFVAETFFVHQRGRKMGIWALLLTLGPPMGPFTAGFIVQNIGWRWIYWVMAILNLCQLLGYLIFGDETVYDREDTERNRPSGKLGLLKSSFTFQRITSSKLSIGDFTLPIILLGNIRVLLATVCYSMIFNLVLVLLPVELPFFYGTIFGLNPQEIGINFLGLLVGCVLGEQIGGPCSDIYRNYLKRKAGGEDPAPERRLVLSHPGFLLSMVGIVVFFVTLADAEPLHWNIKPTVGVAIAGFGSQIVTTVLITYCSDCYPPNKSSAIGVAINLIRCTWGFIGPFWYPHLFASCGLRGSAGLLAGLVILSMVPIVVLQWQSFSKKQT